MQQRGIDQIQRNAGTPCFYLTCAFFPESSDKLLPGYIPGQGQVF